MATNPSVKKCEVLVETRDAQLEGLLTVPEGARGVVAFAHGSGSSRFSPRNQQVADVLNQAGLGTLLFDLLTPEEHDIDQETRELRFNMPLLDKRLTGAVDWLSEQTATKDLTVGLFGASTGAAAALMTAAERPARVRAVVSRGGRPDLAEGTLSEVTSPTLLIVGGNDPQVIELNKTAATYMTCKHKLDIVPGASHLFEEAGKLEEVAALACDWFREHLGGS